MTIPLTSFDTISAEDWHNHQSTWVSEVGNLNPEEVYFEEDVPIEAVILRLQQIDFQH